MAERRLHTHDEVLAEFGLTREDLADCDRSCDICGAQDDAPPRHVDRYSYKGTIATAEWQPEVTERCDEGGAGFHNAIVRGLPYFNGYSLITRVHTNGECEQHRPTGKVFGEPVPSDLR